MPDCKNRLRRELDSDWKHTGATGLTVDEHDHFLNSGSSNSSSSRLLAQSLSPRAMYMMLLLSHFSPLSLSVLLSSYVSCPRMSAHVGGFFTGVNKPSFPWNGTRLLKDNSSYILVRSIMHTRKFLGPSGDWNNGMQTHNELRQSFVNLTRPRNRAQLGINYGHGMRFGRTDWSHVACCSISVSRLWNLWTFTVSIQTLLAGYVHAQTDRAHAPTEYNHMQSSCRMWRKGLWRTIRKSETSGINNLWRMSLREIPYGNKFNWWTGAGGIYE